MAASVGRDFIVKKGATALLGVVSKSVNRTKEMIDITSDDDSGYRTALDVAGVQAIDLDVEFVIKDDVIRLLMDADTTILLTDVTLNYTDGSIVSGDFALESSSETWAVNDAGRGSAAFRSSGAYVNTPAP